MYYLIIIRNRGDYRLTTELAYKSLKELSELIKDLKLSPVELLEKPN